MPNRIQPFICEIKRNRRFSSCKVKHNDDNGDQFPVTLIFAGQLCAVLPRLFDMV